MIWWLMPKIIWLFWLLSLVDWTSFVWTGRLSMTWLIPALAEILFHSADIFAQGYGLKVKRSDSPFDYGRDRFIWLHTIWCDGQVEKIFYFYFLKLFFKSFFRFAANHQQRRRGSRQIRMRGRELAGHWNIERVDAARQRWAAAVLNSILLISYVHFLAVC